MTEDLLPRLKAALQDRYRIERPLGVGGMATVYLAEDLRHHRKVAVKVLRSDLAAALGPERFLQEIEIAAQLQHPNILPLYDSGEADGFLFYVMPHIEGPSLREKLVKEGELPIGDAVRILRDVVDALTEAHAHGVVHRDIKPENILLSGRHALVTDFGVAKAVSEATGRAKLTTAGVALGTPAYMAPEQASADPHLDQRVDIYAVGAVAYELLTGRPVFMGTTPQMILSAHMTEPPQPVTKHRDTVPAALESVVMRCLEKRPADRWQSAEELLPQLEALATPSGGVTPTDTRPMPASLSRKRWLAPVAVAAVVLAIVLGFLGPRLFTRGPISVTTSNLRAVTAEPGVEWQPALSPDGSQVAFVARRDGRWSVVIKSTRRGAGGGEGRPTQGVHDAQEWGPAWSPDGELVRFMACAGGDCAWWEVGQLGGPVRAVGLPGDSSWASWSPDGSHVALFRNDSIRVYSVADGTTAVLAVPPFLFNYSPAWSPGGRWIAYVSGTVASLSSFQQERSWIWIVGAEDGKLVRVTSGEFVDLSPVWLDDEHLLFVSNRDGPREVYVVHMGPTGPRGEPRKVPGGTDAHTISYSITGEKLAFSKATLRQNIWSYPLGPGTVSIADGLPVTSENAVIEAHDVSRDGQRLAYSSSLHGNPDLYTRPVAGGTGTLVIDTPAPVREYDPRWSPDGTEIAFHRESRDGIAVMVVPAEGGTPVQVASASRSQMWMPMWSPGGLDLAFNSNRTGQMEAWVVSREAIGGPWSEAIQMTDFGCQPADWAPDGRGVLCVVDGFFGGAGPGASLVLVSPEGEVLWRYDPAADRLVLSYLYERFSADGSEIYGAGQRNNGAEGIWAIPVQGGEPRLVVAYDDPDLQPRVWLTVGPDRLYLTVQQVEIDIWVADVELER